MLLSDSSDIVIQYTPHFKITPVLIDLVHLKGGRLLAISPTSISLFKDENSIQDPLGNGLISSADWSNTAPLNEINPNAGFVKSFKAGVIHLANEKILLITPVSIQLFNTAHDALHNIKAVAHLELA